MNTPLRHLRAPMISQGSIQPVAGPGNTPTVSLRRARGSACRDVAVVKGVDGYVSGGECTSSAAELYDVLPQDVVHDPVDDRS